jgi:hypothetical protein
MDTTQDYAHEYVPERTFMQKLQEKLAASRFLTFSILFHIIIIVFAGGVVIVKNMADDSDFAAEGGGGLLNEETAAAPEPPEPQVQQQQVFTPTQPTVNTPAVDAIVSNSATNTTFSMQAAMPVIKAPASDAMNTSMSKVAQAAMGKGMGSLPSTMAGRAGGTARNALMQKNNMKEKSEKAVLAGLRWLKKTQTPEGNWSKGQYTASMTGLAVLCFLGHGETPESPEFGPTVKKGVDWILNEGTKFQGRLCMTPTFTQQGVYEHGIAAYALGEYYTMTKDDRVKDVFAQAIAHIIAGQAPDGGWQYSFSKGPDSDTSVSGWQIQALKAAHLSGLNLPGVDECLDKAMLNLKRVNGPKGGFGYRTAQDSYSLTGAGVLCTYFWKGEKDKVVRDGIKFIIEETEKQYPVVYKSEKANLYAWYYHTQACLMFGGSAWTKWNKWFQDEISNAQIQDGPEAGSWPPIPVKEKGAPGPQSAEGGAGPYYRTTLCVLMLEVYYRYMPTNK